ncbi:MAG: hypothetical protein H0U95_09510 [Bacteroidetes bacterium]|nr:hypothetical protein [Bacteroidota bacterium]
MGTLELPQKNGKLLNFVDYELDLVISPPEIKETIIAKTDEIVAENNGKLELRYNNLAIDEGRLKIFICDFSTGKSCIYIYGKVKGKEIKSEIEFTANKSISTNVKNIKIKYVLIYSRNILRNYYLSADTTSIEKHLASFLSTL